MLHPLTIRDLPAVRVTLDDECWDFILCQPRDNGTRQVRLEHGSRTAPVRYERARRVAVAHLQQVAAAGGKVKV